MRTSRGAPRSCSKGSVACRQGHAERSMPLHSDAATAPRHVSDLTRPATRSPTTTRTDYVFLRRGKLLPTAWLFDDAFRIACTSAELVDANGVPTVSAHRMRHIPGTTPPKGAPASRRSWPSSATDPRPCPSSTPASATPRSAANTKPPSPARRASPAPHRRPAPRHTRPAGPALAARPTTRRRRIGASTFDTVRYRLTLHTRPLFRP